jgi:hypothetical protein
MLLLDRLHTTTTIALVGYMTAFLGAVFYLSTYETSPQLIVYAQVNLLLWAVNAAIFLYGLQCAVTGSCNTYAWAFGTVVFILGVLFLIKGIFKFVESEKTAQDRRKNLSPGAKDLPSLMGSVWPVGGVTLPQL